MVVANYKFTLILLKFLKIYNVVNSPKLKISLKIICSIIVKSYKFFENFKTLGWLLSNKLFIWHMNYLWCKNCSYNINHNTNIFCDITEVRTNNQLSNYKCQKNINSSYL